MFKTIQQLDAYFDNREKIGIKPGLERIQFLLRKVNHPENSMKAIHIAGTNGKGSTVTYLEQSLLAMDYKVGTFTSPSLTNRQGMIQLNQKSISDDDYLKYANQLFDAILELEKREDPPSNFELLVVISFCFFQEYADISIVETGMGGKEDATNCIRPLISIITSIGYDHMNFLGNDLAEITNHKAGIIKQKTPIIIGKLPEQALKVIEDAVLLKQAPLFQLGVDFKIKKNRLEAFYQDEQVSFPFQLSMKGNHQFDNAALAIKAILLLEKNSLYIDLNQLKRGLQKAQLPLRFERIKSNPVIVLDGAHNEESLKAFIDTVQLYYPDREKIVLFGAFKDKPISHMVPLLENYFTQVILTSFAHERAASVDDLDKFSTHSNTQKIDNWETFMKQIISEPFYNSKVVFVVGSLELVGRISRFLNEKALPTSD